MPWANLAASCDDLSDRYRDLADSCHDPLTSCSDTASRRGKLAPTVAACDADAGGWNADEGPPGALALPGCEAEWASWGLAAGTAGGGAEGAAGRAAVGEGDCVLAPLALLLAAFCRDLQQHSNVWGTCSDCGVILLKAACSVRVKTL